jgi:type VI secretion system secreted protein Hcp
MPTPGYAKITGATQGNISSGAFTADSVGNIYQSGHEDSNLVEGMSMHVIVPTDPQSGQPTGVRVHQPSKFLKVFDKSSPLLWQALCTGEMLQIEIDFYRIASTGTQQKFFTVKWTDAILVDGKGYMPDCLNPANGNYVDMEEWAFTYRKIEWDHTVAGTSGSDDWRAPNQS